MAWPYFDILNYVYRKLGMWELKDYVSAVEWLTDLNKDFEMMIYPGGRHGWGPPKVYHTKREMEEFWKESFNE